MKLAAMVLAIAVSLGLWDKRGAVVGAVALLVYGGIVLTAMFNHSGTLAWSRRHVALDASFVVPLTFLALAYLTALPLGVCVLIAAAMGAVLVAVAVWRARRQRSGGCGKPL
jgi:hypothetical protein